MDLGAHPHVTVLATESCEQALLLPCWAALSSSINTCMVLAAASCKHQIYQQNRQLPGSVCQKGSEYLVMSAAVMSR